MKSVYYSLLHIIKNPWVSSVKGILLYFYWQIKKRWGNYPMIINIEDDIKIELLNPRIALEGGTKLYTQGLYDGNNMRMVDAYFAKWDEVFWDIGANLGLYSLVASRHGQAKVVSFEPHPMTYSLLNRQIQLNLRANIKSVNIALSNENAKVLFSNVDGSSTNSILLEGVNTERSIEIESRRGEDLIVDGETAPSVIKIDVEGFEWDVILGFGEQLKNVKICIVEVSRYETEIYEYMKQSGFLGPFELDLIHKKYTSYKRGRSQEDPVWIHSKFANLIFRELLNGE
jgi:FkbM family methyltransferase